jgi:hypothetical protein
MAEVEVFGVAAAPAAPVVAAPVAAAPVAAAPVAGALPFMGCQQMSNTHGVNYLEGSAPPAPYLLAQWLENGCKTWPQAWAPSNKNLVCMLDAVNSSKICTNNAIGGGARGDCQLAREVKMKAC